MLERDAQCETKGLLLIGSVFKSFSLEPGHQNLDQKICCFISYEIFNLVVLSREGFHPPFTTTTTTQGTFIISGDTHGSYNLESCYWHPINRGWEYY